MSIYFHLNFSPDLTLAPSSAHCKHAAPRLSRGLGPGLLTSFLSLLKAGSWGCPALNTSSATRSSSFTPR